MPISITEVDRQLRSVLGQLFLEGFDESQILLVDRALPSVMIVVFGDFQQTFARDRFASNHIL